MSDLIGGIMGLFADDPTFRTLRNTKNKTIDSGQTSLLGDWQNTRQSGQDALGDYIGRYMGGLKNAEQRSAQEIGAIDPFYNGGMSSSLASLRNRRQEAVNNAADVAVAEAQRRASLSRLGSQGGASSYDSRLRSALLAPIRTQAAVDNAAQERADLDYLVANQIGLAGRRQQLADAMAAYGLAPEQMRRNFFQSDLSGLTGLSQLDNSNNIYGVQKRTTDLDRWGGFADGLLNTAAGVAGAAGQAGGSL